MLYSYNTTAMKRIAPSDAIMQCLHENETWKRLLAFIQTENVILKTRLAEYIRETSAPSRVEMAESYQNRFLNTDEHIALLRRDLAQQEKWMLQLPPHEKQQLQTVMQKHEQLKREMHAAEKNFQQLQFVFNRFLADPSLA